MGKKLTPMMQLREILNKEDSRILNDGDYNKGWNDAIDLVLVKINLSMLPIEREQKIDDFTDGQNKGVMQFVGLLKSIGLLKEYEYEIENTKESGEQYFTQTYRTEKSQRNDGYCKIKVTL